MFGFASENMCNVDITHVVRVQLSVEHSALARAREYTHTILCENKLFLLFSGVIRNCSVCGYSKKKQDITLRYNPSSYLMHVLCRVVLILYSTVIWFFLR